MMKINFKDVDEKDEIIEILSDLKIEYTVEGNLFIANTTKDRLPLKTIEIIKSIIAGEFNTLRQLEERFDICVDEYYENYNFSYCYTYANVNIDDKVTMKVTVYYEEKNESSRDTKCSFCIDDWEYID